MATHDYVIDNGTGSAVRADLNNLFKAILTNNSGTTDPSTVISSDAGSKAFSFWADTNSSPAVLKIRNAADDGWIELFQLDGTLTLEDGSASSPALAFRDDLNTGIFSSAADTLNFTTGGVERLELGAATVFNEDGADVDFRIEGDTEANLFYVDAGTNTVVLGDSAQIGFAVLGIKVDTSSQNGLAFKTSSNGSFGALRALNASGTEVCNIQFDTTNSAMNFRTANTERMRIDSSGRLLLGTTTEGFASFGDTVTIATSADTGITVRSGTSNRGSIYFSDGTSGDAETQGFIQYAHNDSRLVFGTDATERMRIDSSGRVLIGTTTEGHEAADDLTIENTSADMGITLRSGTSGQGAIYFSDGTSGDAEYRGILNYNHNSNFFSFFTNASEGMRLDSSGRLFVGRTNNIAVGGNVSDHCFEQITNDGYTLTIHADKTNQRGIGMFYTSGKTPEAYMLCQVDTTNKFIIAGSGNVTNANNSYGQISDISLKENIVDANSQWDDIKNLRIRNFNFKSSTGYDTHTQIGLVAQEVETVSPKLVDTDKDGIKRVTSSVLYMKAVKCLQEAIAKIEVLETKVATLEAA